jgi:hypothetical protein
MSYSKDHAKKNPLAPSRMYGMSSSANANKTPTKSDLSNSESASVDVMHGQDDYNITHYATEKGHGMSRMTPKKGYNKETKKWEGLQPKYTMHDQSNPNASSTSMTQSQFIDHLSRGKKTKDGRLKFFNTDERHDLVMTGGTKGFKDEET